MKIILLKDIPKIGKKNEVKEVADGYALNFVIPMRLGIKATDAEIKKIEIKKSAQLAEKQIEENLLTKSLENLSTITVSIIEKANEKGHLFEGIRSERLVKEIEKVSGISLDPNYIALEKPLKEIGEYIVPVEAHGKKGKVKVVIEAEKE